MEDFMKYSEVWSKLLTQNLTLRTAIVVLGVCQLYLGGVIIYQASKDPVIVERSCFSKYLQNGSAKHTEDEIKTFVELGLSQRFDSDGTPYANFLNDDVSEKVRLEKEELQKNGMRQKVIVNGMTVAGDLVTVDADRLISVKHIRSAFPFPLSVKIRSVGRTEANAYGLQIVEVTAQKVDEEKNEKKE